jgi:hypothetical protein
MVALLCGWLPAGPLSAATIWVEGEKPVQSTMHRHPWWYDQVRRDQLSGGDLLSNFHKEAGEAEYAFRAPAGGSYEFWVRANPVQASLSYRLNGRAWSEIDLKKDQTGITNIAADGKIDLRFIAWVKVGSVPLQKGDNRIRFRMDSKSSNHGYLDCFVFSSEPFTPRGILKPDQIAAATARAAEENKGWFAFAPREEKFTAQSGFDLRTLNESFAGEGGFIAVKDGQFVHGTTGQPVRFWGVNGPPHDLDDPAAIRRTARLLAKYGVNLVRVHGGYFNEQGDVDPERVKHALAVVAGMKAEGIYSHFSIYFPLWLKPKPGTPWLAGYDGVKHPFAALYFNKEFQQRYREWWKALLLTPDAKTGRRLVDEPAVSSLEIINEDSYFFWTFATANIPPAQLQILEGQFGDWLKQQYGSIDGALQRWHGVRTPRDQPADGRMGFRPLWNIANERTVRDQDTVRFLLESQRNFYAQTCQFLRGLGFKGLITASNWATASPQFLGPLEKYSYTPGDFIDRHGYFGCNQQGDNAGWSIRAGHTYSDRSALRFDAEQPGRPKLFVHPAMDPHYDGKPSMISETTWNRPNRYRSEAPLFYACYGALQGSDAIIHFALDSSTWAVKPGFFMQPWTLLSPALAGQFPAAALIYRSGLVETGNVLAEVNLKVQDLLELRGTPLPQDAAFDELRLKDVPPGQTVKPGGVIDPLIHFAGRTNVHFTEQKSSTQLTDLTPYVDHQRHRVRSSTGQLLLDYGRGVLAINAPAAQGVSGALGEVGQVDLRDLAIRSDLPLGHIVVVSLDGQPLASSAKMLLQVMTEEKGSDFQTEPVSETVQRITNIGHDPWLIRAVRGTVEFKRPDARQLRVTALDHSGYPLKEAGDAQQIVLQPATLYYLISR